MENNSTNPVLILASAAAVFVTGGFLLVVQVGVNGREAQGIHPYSNFQGEPTASSAAASYFNDFERGKQIIKNRSDNFMSGFFGGPAAAKPAAGVETASREAFRDENESPYKGKFEEDTYSGSGSEAGNNFWSGMGGGESAAGGGMGNSMGSSLSGAMKTGASAKNSSEAFGDAPPAGGKKGRGRHAPQSIFGGAATRDERAAAPKLSASLSGKNTPKNQDLNRDGQPGSDGASPGSGGRKSPKGGSLSGMPGQKAGADLDGAAEKMKTASASDYKSRMSGGAAAVASGSGSSGSGSSGSGSAGGTVGAPEKVSSGTGAKTGDSKKTASEDGADEGWTYAPADNGKDLLALVLREKLNGKDAKYLSEADTAAPPDENLMRAKGMALDFADKGLSEPEPEDLDSLPDNRKEELKKELHVFMAQVETQHGKADIFRTACTLTPNVCKTHEIKGSYLTMTTMDGTKLVFGLKYADAKWRLYTMDLIPPE